MTIDQRDYYYAPKVFRKASITAQTVSRTSGFSWRIALPFWLAVLGIGYFVFAEGISRRPALPLPESAPMVINQLLGPSVSPLTIHSPRSGRGVHYLVKLEEWNSSNLGLMVFVREGESVTTKIPSGIYRIKVGSGESWFGLEHLFGAGMLVETGKVALRFTGNQGQIVDLTQVISGNLPMDRGLRF